MSAYEGKRKQVEAYFKIDNRDSETERTHSPYEVRVYDISDPMSPPWNCLMRDYDYDDFDGAEAWSEDNELTYYREYEVCTYFGEDKRDHV